MSQTDAHGPSAQPLARVRRTVVVVDVVESVRLLLSHEEAVIARWCALTRTTTDELLPGHGGRLVKSLGDGMLLEFRDAPQAVATAFALQALCARGNAGLPAEAAMLLRIGVHVCEVIVTELDVFGAGVNLAARLAALGRPGDVVVSAELREQLVPGVHAALEDLGDCFLKHIDQPCRAYRARPVGADPALSARLLGLDSRARPHSTSGTAAMTVVAMTRGSKTRRGRRAARRRSTRSTRSSKQTRPRRYDRNGHRGRSRVTYGRRAAVVR